MTQKGVLHTCLVIALMIQSKLSLAVSIDNDSMKVEKSIPPSHSSHRKATTEHRHTRNIRSNDSKKRRRRRGRGRGLDVEDDIYHNKNYEDQEDGVAAGGNQDVSDNTGTVTKTTSTSTSKTESNQDGEDTYYILQETTIYYYDEEEDGDESKVEQPELLAPQLQESQNDTADGEEDYYITKTTSYYYQEKKSDTDHERSTVDHDHTSSQQVQPRHYEGDPG